LSAAQFHRSLWFEGAERLRLEETAQSPLCCRRVFAHEIAIRQHQAAEVLRPGFVGRGVDETT